MKFTCAILVLILLWAAHGFAAAELIQAPTYINYTLDENGTPFVVFRIQDELYAYKVSAMNNFNFDMPKEGAVYPVKRSNFWLHYRSAWTGGDIGYTVGGYATGADKNAKHFETLNPPDDKRVRHTITEFLKCLKYSDRSYDFRFHFAADTDNGDLFVIVETDLSYDAYKVSALKTNIADINTADIYYDVEEDLNIPNADGERGYRSDWAAHKHFKSLVVDNKLRAQIPQVAKFVHQLTVETMTNRTQD